MKLTLRDAEALALKNHPQVLAAQHAASAMNQRIDETRAAYYPALSGDVTGSQANPRARIGAGLPHGLPPLRPRRPGHHAQPVDYGFRTHPQPGGHLASRGRRRRADRPGHQVRRPGARQPGLLRNAARPGAGESGAGNGRDAPVARRPDYRALQQQASLGIGRQLRGCEPVAGQAAAAPGAGPGAGGLRGTDPRDRLPATPQLINSKTSPFHPALRRTAEDLVAQAHQLAGRNWPACK